MGKYEYYDVDEVAQLIDGMDDSDILKCMKAANYFVCKYSLPMEAEDLFQEAITRIYEGRRQVPKDVEVPTALNHIMKSISYEILTERSGEPLRCIDDSADDLSTIDETQPSDAVQLDYQWNKLLTICKDDKAAIALLQATENRQKKAQIVESVFNGDHKAYDTTRRRIIRHARSKMKESNS